MKTVKPALPWRRRSHLGFEVRYERSFLIDLQQLDPVSFRYIKRFVLEDFHQLSQLQELPNFRQIGSSGIFYRFTLDRYLIGLEVTGQLVKFLRVMPLPDV